MLHQFQISNIKIQTCLTLADKFPTSKIFALQTILRRQSFILVKAKNFSMTSYCDPPIGGEAISFNNKTQKIDGFAPPPLVRQADHNDGTIKN